MMYTLSLDLHEALVKTDRGAVVLKDRSVSLTPCQRAAFVLIDGRKAVRDLLAITRAAGITLRDIQHLLELELVRPVPTIEDDVSHKASADAGTVTEQGMSSTQARYALAYPIATRLTAELGLRGFRLNLAVEGASGFEDLVELAPRIRDAVGPSRFLDLERALNG